LKEENYTSAIGNHISKIEFQLSEYRRPYVEKKLMTTWPVLSEELNKVEYFGEQIGRENVWLKDDVTQIIEGAATTKDKAKKIFEYVRDNFVCTDRSALFMNQVLKNLVKTKSGAVSEINLLLTAMLRNAGLVADPVILSTRSNGFSYSLYPILSQYNYVICRIVIDGKELLLDASEPLLGFGFLPLRCYNGHARVISDNPLPLEIAADSVLEKKMTTIFIINNEKGEMVGSMNQTPGYYESFSLRRRIKEKGKAELLSDIKKDFGTDIEISNFQIDSLKKYEEQIVIRYDFDLKGDMEDIIYLNPMFGEGLKENPFKSAERLYPVEMPYTFDETYNLQMEVPTGYVIDELPKSMVVKLNEENEGIFEYRISQSGSAISFRSIVKIDRAYFQPEEYGMLREFFNLVVKKQAEQIVFKKKK
jgi:Transglutaminase-like superfamily